MTVCIAAICDQGERVVTATDGALTLGGVRGDTLVPGKMLWFSDWLLLWAGEPGNIDSIIEHLRHMTRAERDCLAREKIRNSINTAFKRFVAEWVANDILAPYDMDMSEYKKKGRAIFGDPVFREISKQMNEAVKTYLLDEMLVVGWGKSPYSALLFQRSATMSASHALSGVAAIGSGREVALSTLLMLGQSRHSPLEEAVYNVAAAKFMAEKSEGDEVGRATGMFIARKRLPSDAKDEVPGTRIQAREVKEIRELWEEYGKPRIPAQAMFPIENILKKSGVKDFQLSAGTKLRLLASGIEIPGGQMTI